MSARKGFSIGKIREKWEEITSLVRDTICVDNDMPVLDTASTRQIPIAEPPTFLLKAIRYEMSLICIFVALIGLSFETAVYLFAVGLTFATGLYMLTLYPSLLGTLGIIVITWSLLEDSLYVNGPYYEHSIRWVLIAYTAVAACFPLVMIPLISWSTPLTTTIVMSSYSLFNFIIPFFWIVLAYSNVIKF